MSALAFAVPGATAGRTMAIVQRNYMTYRHTWTLLVSAIIEPMLYLVSVGIGVGALVGSVPGVHVRYAVYVAPALLATSAMNTAFNQTSFGVFARIKLDKTYDAILPTPVSVTDIAIGEVIWSVISSLISSVAFLAVIAALGFVTSPWALLAVPASVVIGFAFAAGGLAVTTYMRDFSDGQLVQLVMLPMFLFATTFYPVSVYAAPLRPVIEALPLYQSIELIREPALGHFGWGVPAAAAYLLAFGALALTIAIRRMSRTLLH